MRVDELLKLNLDSKTVRSQRQESQSLCPPWQDGHTPAGHRVFSTLSSEGQTRDTLLRSQVPKYHNDISLSETDFPRTVAEITGDGTCCRPASALSETRQGWGDGRRCPPDSASPPDPQASACRSAPPTRANTGDSSPFILRRLFDLHNSQAHKS